MNAREAVLKAAESVALLRNEGNDLETRGYNIAVDRAYRLLRAFAETLESEPEGWKPHTEQPVVSAWRWIQYWTMDGIPGIRQFHLGDDWLDSDIACWRFVDRMPPYAAAPSRETKETK